MKNLSLILRIVAIVAAVAATTLFFISKGKLAEKEELLTKAKNYIKETNAKLEETENSLENTQNQLELERESLAETRETLGETQSKLFDSQAKAERNQKLLGEALEEVSGLKQTASKLRTDLVATQEALQKASKEAEINQLNERIAELESKNTDLERELKAAESLAEAISAKTKTTVGNQTTPNSLQPNLASLNTGDPIKRVRQKTTIKSISTRDGLIILENGPDLNLSEGQLIILVQDVNSAAKVRIQSVTEEHAVANILPDNSKRANQLSPGNTVELLL